MTSKLSRIVVTGGSGRLGAYVVRALADVAEISVLDLVPPPSGIRHHQVDLLDPPGLLKALEGCDAVVHLAGRDLSRGGTAEEYAQANILGTLNLLNAARDAGVPRVVQCSTTAVYGLLDGPGLRPERLPIDEDHPCRPTSPYSLSKMLAEHVCKALSDRDGPDIISLRAAMVAYPDQLAEMVDAGRARAPGRLFAYIFPEDLAQAMKLALDADISGWLAVNIAAPDTYASEPTLGVVKRLYGRLPRTVDRPVFEQNPHVTLFDLTLAQKRLGFSTQRRWSINPT